MRRLSIVGGGIAGLALAAALERALEATDARDGVEFVVHEAQPERAGFGGALAIWPAAGRALDRLGVREEALGTRAVSAGLDGAGDRDGSSAVGALRDIRTGRAFVRARHAPFRLTPRPALLAALDRAVPPTVRRVAEEVTDPTALDADLVVGADGVRSVVRGIVHPTAATREETPWVALRGARAEVPTADAYGEYWGRGLLFGLVPVPGMGHYWFTTHRSDLGPEPLDPGQVLDEAHRAFAGTAPVVRETLAQAGPETLATRIWVAPPLPRYVRDRYVVVGDAAHGMTPNLGRGACDAILDAVTLADALVAGPLRSGTARARPLAPDPLLAWQARRVPFTQAARATSGLLMHLALSGFPPRRPR